METKRVAIHVWHLEMTTRPEASEHAKDNEPHYELRKATTPLPELNRFLYATVGAGVMWYMRLTWDYDQWVKYLNRPQVTTWIAYVGGTPIGYFELEDQPGGNVEIVYFGLIPEFIGKGYGSSLLSDAIEKAWSQAKHRIWLHTCTLDHPNALPNYLNRGFRVFREEDFEEDIPAASLQPWPNANKHLNPGSSIR